MSLESNRCQPRLNIEPIHLADCAYKTDVSKCNDNYAPCKIEKAGLDPFFNIYELNGEIKKSLPLHMRPQIQK